MAVTSTLTARGQSHMNPSRKVMIGSSSVGRGDAGDSAASSLREEPD